jgi:predicted RNA-binding protein with PUA-like domain
MYGKDWRSRGVTQNQFLVTEEAMAERKYWLFKSEPNAYSFNDLQGEPDQTAEWDGVRNYQARNFIRDEMKVGDGVLFYHSSTNPMAIVGTATIVREAYPDATAWNPGSKYYDPKSTPEKPVWVLVDIKADQKIARPVTLQEIKQNPKLQDMLLVRRGMRLSIQPVTKDQWDEIVALGSQG